MEKLDQSTKEKSEQLLPRLKECLFQLYDQLVGSNICNSLVLIVVTIIESLIFMQTIAQLLDNASNLTLNSAYEFLNYINPAYLLTDTAYTLYVVICCLGFSLLFVLLFIILFICQWNATNKTRHSIAYSYILRIASFILIILKYMLFQPLIMLMLNTLTCDSKNTSYTCYDQIHLILVSCSVVMVILLVILCLLSIIFFADEMPDSKLPWAYCSRLLEVYKLIRKLLISLCLYISDNNSSVGILAMVCSIFLSGLCIYELLKQVYMNDKKVYYALCTSEGTIAWFSLVVIFYMITDINWGNPIILIVFVALLLAVVVLASKQYSEKLLYQHSIPMFKESIEVETYCRVLLDMVTSTKQLQEISIEGIVSTHASSCKQANCPCHSLVAKSRDEEEKSAEVEEAPGKNEEPESDSVRKQDSTKQKYGGGIGPDKSGMDIESAENDLRKTLFFKLIMQEVSQWNEKQEKKVRLNIYLGYLKMTCMENKLAALYEVMCAEEGNCNVYEQFLAFRLNKRIEDSIMKRESREQSSNEIDNLIKFQQILAEMQENMQEALKLFIGFWKELQDESPNFQYLGNMSHEITGIATKIRSSYRDLIAISSYNIYCRMLYALFLKKIIKDEFEAWDVYEETSRANNNLRLHNKLTSDEKYGANSRTALFIISGVKSNIGEVLCINNEVSEFLGYEKNEIMGHNISKIMPPIIAAKHSQIITAFFCSGRTAPSGDRMVLPLHKYGYFIPCYYLHRVVPNLQRGLQLIGFLYRITDFSKICPLVEKSATPDDVVLMLTDELWNLQAFNMRTSKLFGINPAQANLRKYISAEEKISVLKLIPSLTETGFVMQIKSTGSAEVVLNLKAMHKIIDSEIEIMKVSAPTTGDNQDDQAKLESGELRVIEETEKYRDLGSPASESSVKGPLTYVELPYGKDYENKEAEIRLKLIMVVVDQILENKPLKEKDDREELTRMKSKKGGEMVMEEMISQSQSSHSSHSSAEHEQKNIRSFKERIKEQKKPFFVRCFIKLGVMIFLLILAAGILEFVLINLMISFLSTSFNNADLIYKRYTSLLSIPNSFRTINQIYDGIEPDSSDIFTYRITSYEQLIATALEELRTLSNSIEKMSHPYSNQHLNILDQTVVKFAEQPDSSSVSKEVSYMNYTLAVGITKYVAKGTELKSFASILKYNGSSNASSSSDESLRRLFSFMIDNGKGSMTYFVEKTKSLFVDEINNEIQSKGKIITIALIADPLVIIILMIMFVPFILKVQSSLLKIYLHLCQFKEADIRRWLEICNNSASDIKASITRMKAIYNAEKFEVNLEELKNRDRKEEAGDKAGNDKSCAAQAQGGNQQQVTTTKNNNTTQKSTEIGLIDDGKKEGDEGDDKEAIMVSKEEVISDRKQKMFSRMTKEKTKAYLIYMLLFAIYIGIFRTADGLLFSRLYSATDMKVYIIQTMAAREHNDINSIFYLRENFKANIISKFFDKSDATGNYTSAAFDSEMEISKLRSQLTGDLSSLKDFLNSVDSSAYCQTLTDRNASLMNQTLCSSAYQGLLNLGFNSVIINALSYIRKAHERFKLEYNTSTAYADLNIQSSDIQKMNDNFYSFVGYTHTCLFDIFAKIIDDWIASERLAQNIKFAMYIIFLFIIFIFLWQKMVTNMKMDIIKALGILNILPTVHLATNPEFIKDMNKSNLIN